MGIGVVETFVNNILSFWKEIGALFPFAAEFINQSFRFFKTRQVAAIVLYRQILFTGYEALSLTTLFAIAIGGIIILEGNLILGNFGQSKLVYVILVSVIVREISNLLVAFLIIARSGTAIASELGNMVINHEVEALKSFGISPIYYLVVPRVVGVVVSLVVLNIYFNIAGLLGGWFVSSLFTPIPFSQFMNGLLSEMGVLDLLSSMFKSVVFGFIIGFVSCHQGLQVAYSVTEIPQRTIKAVVHSLTLVIIFNILITTLFYLV